MVCGVLQAARVTEQIEFAEPIRALGWTPAGKVSPLFDLEILEILEILTVVLVSVRRSSWETKKESSTPTATVASTAR